MEMYVIGSLSVEPYKDQYVYNQRYKASKHYRILYANGPIGVKDPDDLYTFISRNIYDMVPGRPFSATQKWRWYNMWGFVNNLELKPILYRPDDSLRLLQPCAVVTTKGVI